MILDQRTAPLCLRGHELPPAQGRTARMLLASAPAKGHGRGRWGGKILRGSPEAEDSAVEPRLISVTPGERSK